MFCFTWAVFSILFLHIIPLLIYPETLNPLDQLCLFYQIEDIESIEQRLFLESRLKSGKEKGPCPIRDTYVEGRLELEHC